MNRKNISRNEKKPMVGCNSKKRREKKEVKNLNFKLRFVFS